MNRVLLVVLLFAAALPPLLAQGREVAFRTLCLEQVEGYDSVIVPGRTPDEGREIILYTTFSEVIKNTFKSDTVELYATDAEGERKVVARGKLTKSPRQLFLLIPDPRKDAPRPYLLKCYDDDLKAFPMGHIRAINLATSGVRFVIAGKTTPTIPPAKEVQFPHTKDVNEYGMYPVKVDFETKSGEWITGQSVSWRATDRRRDIVVTMIDPKFNQPTVRTYADVPPWTEKTAGGAP